MAPIAQASPIADCACLRPEQAIASGQKDTLDPVAAAFDLPGQPQPERSGKSLQEQERALRFEADYHYSPRNTPWRIPNRIGSDTAPPPAESHAQITM